MLVNINEIKQKLFNFRNIIIICALFIFTIDGTGCICSNLIIGGENSESAIDSGSYRRDSLIKERNTDENSQLDQGNSEPIFLDENVSCNKLLALWPKYLIQRQNCKNDSDCRMIHSDACGCDSGISINNNYYVEASNYFYKLIGCEKTIKECKDSYPPLIGSKCQSGRCISNHREFCPPTP